MSSEKKLLPVASLQMLWGRIYTIWDPQLAQASLRTRSISFDPFMVEFAEKSFNLGKETFAKLMADLKVVPEFVDSIHAGMQPKHILAMDTIALRGISQTLDNITSGEDGGVDAVNLYDWVKDLITIPTIDALLGPCSPFLKDPSLYDDIW